ncbi:Zn-DD-carboxypeptidase_like domain containing protein [Rhabdaerophilaceae bacterium]
MANSLPNLLGMESVGRDGERKMSGARVHSSRLPRAGLTASLAVIAVLGANRGTQDAAANGDTRTIELYHAHTRESIRATFRRDGSYDNDALSKLNHFLRDWRNDEQVAMAPQLFDIVWYAYREVGATEPVKVVSAYRSPGTNAMLARRSRAVAKNSQHMRGQAMDMHIPGVSMAKVREIAMRLQRGGVGYYPTAGSPFVHLDVGTVRSWPRMPRQQLERMFPDGKTVHIPADGIPLSNYQVALAEVQARGGSALDYDTVRSSSGKTLWALLFGSGEEDDSSAERAPTRIATARGAARLAASAPRSAEPAAGVENVMVASVQPADTVAVRRPTAVRSVPVQAELRPQPGTEPAVAAPVAPIPAGPPPPAVPVQAVPVLVASLPVPPVRPRLVVEPLSAQTFALAGVSTATLAPGLAVPPVRPAAAPEAVAPVVVATAPLPAPNLPVPPARPAQAVPGASEAVPALPGLFRAPSATSSPVVQAYAPANLPMPPRRPAAAAAEVARATLPAPGLPAERTPPPPLTPVAVKTAVDHKDKDDLAAIILAESARSARPRHVVNVAPPQVEGAVRAQVVSRPLARSAQPEVAPPAFAGSFIRPMAGRFTKAGD